MEFRQTRRISRNRANVQTKTKQKRTRQDKTREAIGASILSSSSSWSTSSFCPLLRVPESPQPAINCAPALLLAVSSLPSFVVSKTKHKKNGHAEGSGRAGLCSARPGEHGEVHGQLAQAVSAKYRWLQQSITKQLSNSYRFLNLTNSLSPVESVLHSKVLHTYFDPLSIITISVRVVLLPESK